MLKRSPSAFLWGIGSFFGLFSYLGYKALGLCQRAEKRVSDSEAVVRALQERLKDLEEEIVEHLP